MAFITFGEGYLNFHHEFPSDYRNAIKFYQWDPDLVPYFQRIVVRIRTPFPRTRCVHMLEKRMRSAKETWTMDHQPNICLKWIFKTVRFDVSLLLRKDCRVGAPASCHFWVVYDVTKFMDKHPGGKIFLRVSVGPEVTSAFNGYL
ncbi:hypothetical protein BC830DRAFT_827645 [Chytriomyces sp. MP71]|nr:hypothetical protein BC830DRAFT_827645 [Chytriomyces sp. MP71]